MGGALDLRNLKGYLDVTTMGGAITLKDSEVDGRAKTMGGEVLVENVKGDINASSMGGKVSISTSAEKKSLLVKRWISPQWEVTWILTRLRTVQG